MRYYIVRLMRKLGFIPIDELKRMEFLARNYIQIVGRLRKEIADLLHKQAEDKAYLNKQVQALNEEITRKNGGTP